MSGLHPAMLTVFLQALSEVWIDKALAIHGIILRTKKGRRTRRGGVS
jgi:hypothetical protein